MWRAMATLAVLALAVRGAALAGEEGSPPPFDVRPAIALAEARRIAAIDEPAKRREHLGVALERLGAAAMLNPSEPVPFRVLARIRLDLNQPRAALGAADRAIALAPADALGPMLRGEALLRLGRDAAAEEALTAAAGADPPRPEAAAILRERARARLRLGRFKAAAEDARRAAALEPSSADGEALVRWCAAREETALAIDAGAPAGEAYAVHSEIGLEAARRAAEGLERLERSFAALVPLPEPPVRPVPVFLLRGARFGRLAPAGARAFYQRDEMAVFVLAEKPAEVERLVLHEAAHAHLHRAIEDAPAWLDEGLADVFAAEPHPVRLRDLKVFFSAGHDVRFADLAFRSRRELYDAEGLHLRFAAAWGWVHFLRAEHPRRLERYLETIIEGGSAEEAFQAAFSDIADFVAFESAFRAHIVGLRLDE